MDLTPLLTTITRTFRGNLTASELYQRQDGMEFNIEFRLSYARDCVIIGPLAIPHPFSSAYKKTDSLHLQNHRSFQSR